MQQVMKAFMKILILPIALILLASIKVFSAPRPGFYIPEHIQQVTFRYQMINNLIVLPVTINDTIQVNLILDTGCRNLVLFGKRFQKLFQFDPKQVVKFSGLGNGNPVVGKLALNNKVSIDAVLGEEIPVIVIEKQNLFHQFKQIHGVIGYDIFTKFEVEINPKTQMITFRPAASAILGSDFRRVPIRVEDSRPLIDCRVIFTKDKTHICDLMIDTGSALGLLLKTNDIYQYDIYGKKTLLGRGLNGDIYGLTTSTEKLLVSGLEMTNLMTGIIQSEWQNYASIGMEVLKDYAMVLNYCKGYAGFRKV
jgi:Aspartyl protease